MNLKDEILANRNDKAYFSKDKFNKKEKQVLNGINSIKKNINKYIDNEINFREELDKIIVNKLSRQQKCFIDLNDEDYQFEMTQSQFEVKKFGINFIKPLFSIIENKFDEDVEEINNYFDKFNKENDGIKFIGKLYEFYIHVDFSINYTYGTYKVKYEGFAEDGANDCKLTITLDKDKVIDYLISQGLNASAPKKIKDGKYKIRVSLDK